MDVLPYNTIPDYPSSVSAGTVLARLIDGLAFRYRWATEGLSPDEMGFSPGAESMSLGQLLAHILSLISWVDQTFGGEKRLDGERLPLAELRAQTLRRCVVLRARLARMSEAEIAACAGPDFEFWNLINGPVADALTHIGQVNAWRRLAGNPTPRANVFRGRPPEQKEP